MDLGSDISWSFTFTFYYINPFGGSSPLLHITLFTYPFFKATLTSDIRKWGSFVYFLHWFKNYGGNCFVSAKMKYKQLHILAPNCFGNIFNVYIFCFLIFQSLQLFFDWNNNIVVVFINFICFCIYISISIFFLPEADCSNLVPVELSCTSSKKNWKIICI